MDFPAKKKKEDKVKDRDMERRVARYKFLMEKYGQRWRNKLRRGGHYIIFTAST